MSPLKNRFFDSKIVLNLTTIVTVVVIWYFVAQANFFPAIFLPTPKATFGSLWALIVSGKFFHALLISSLRIIGATILAVIIGAVVGVLMGMSKKIEALLMPITQPIRYLPITALLPLFILWFGIGEAMKVMFLFVGIVFYFIPFVANAIRTTPLEYIEVARGLGANVIALGSFSILGGQPVVAMRLVKVETGEVVGGVTERGDEASQLDLLSERAAKSLGDALSQTKPQR